MRDWGNVDLKKNDIQKRKTAEYIFLEKKTGLIFILNVEDTKKVFLTIFCQLTLQTMALSTARKMKNELQENKKSPST